jgi:fructokinase
MILSCGEALIDFMPRETTEGALAFQPLSGGSLFNTAIAMGRLGVEAGFFGGLSSDFFGDQLRDAFKASNVDFSLSPISDRYTICAFVKLFDGHARYSFISEGSACRMLSKDDLPVLEPRVEALHMGSFSVMQEPSGSALEELCARAHVSRVISFDPNIRPSLVNDRPAYLARIKRTVAMADIVKLSDEDLKWMSPSADPDSFAKDWLKQGAKIVVITRGGEGAVAFSKLGKTEIPGVKVKVADTVGAGDTFTAGLLVSFHRQGKLTKKAIAEIDEASLRQALGFAARAAAITCSRPGADPPWAHEVQD